MDGLPVKFSAIPAPLIIQLGQAFSFTEPADISLDDRYDLAMYHLLAHRSRYPVAAGEPAHLVAVLRYVSEMLIGSTAELTPEGFSPPGAKSVQAAQPSQATVLAVNPTVEAPPADEAPQTANPPEAAPAKPVKVNAEGYPILDYIAGEHLTTDQVRERLGLSKSHFARLLQAGQMMRPAGVIVMPTTGRQVKVYYAEEADRWRKPARKPMSEEAKQRIQESQIRAKDLPIVPWQAIDDGNYMTWDQVEEYTTIGRATLYRLQAEDEFPRVVARSQNPNTHVGYTALFLRNEVVDWVGKSQHPQAFRSRDRRSKGLKVSDKGGIREQHKRTADDGAEPQPEELPPAPASDAPAQPAEPVARKVSLPSPTGWMNLRQVAEYTGLGERELENMIRARKFPQAQKRNDRLHLREWSARVVAKWKRERIDNGALA